MSGEEIKVSIVAKGDEIRELKKQGESKEDLQSHIDELISLKNQYKEVTGEDYVAPNQGSSRKRNQEKKNEDQGGESNEEGDATSENANEEGKKSKKQLNKEKRKAQKAARRAEEAAKKAMDEEGKKEEEGKVSSESNEDGSALFGDADVIVSATMSDRVWTQINSVTQDLVGQEVLVRGRVQKKRQVGKGVFLLVRDGVFSIQAIAFAGL